MRLADIGQAKPIKQVRGTACGTLWYVAAEVFSAKLYTEKADIFSLGIIMWELWNKKRGHEATPQPQLQLFFQLVEEGKLRPGNEEFIGEEIRYGQQHEMSVFKCYQQQHEVGQGISTFQGKQQQQQCSLRPSKAKRWADLSRACWSSCPDNRPSADAIYKAINAISNTD